ncbi:MAG TPA: branched-chain amino acid ABC transporter substrate-binding protein [Actinomycetota bacterium]|nr:branched-chain amino acid ABC transporter substrate-binding protein [Actinomycetota bacterium]
MTRRKGLALVALFGALTLVTAACANDEGGGGETGTTGTGGTGAGGCEADQFGCVEVGSGEPITIGTLLAIEGDVAFLGLDSQYGVELAVDYLDGAFDGTPGQIAGHDVTLVNENDGCSAEGGQAGATKLAADAQMVAVIGTSCSSSALGVADQILAEKGILLVSPSNTNPNLTAEGVTTGFYARTAHNDKIQGAIVADFAIQELGAKTAATINDESPYADALAAVFRAGFEAQGGSITTFEAIQSTDTDFKPLLTSIAEQSPDVLYFPDFNPACALISKQAADIPGLKDTALIGSDGCADPSFTETAGAAADGNYISQPDTSAFTQGDFYQSEFLPAYQDLVGDSPTAAFHAHAFDAMNIVADAIEAVAIDNDDGSISIPRTALKDALLATSGYEGITGTITCDPLGDCATDVTIGVYQVPAVPFDDPKATPVFSETKTLADVAA